MDSYDGSFHHAAMVSTRHINSGDGAANNNGFRCITRDTSINTTMYDDDDGDGDDGGADGKVHSGKDDEKKRKQQQQQYKKALEGGASILELEKEYMKKNYDTIKQDIMFASKEAKKRRKRQKEKNKQMRKEGEKKWKEDRETMMNKKNEQNDHSMMREDL